MTIGKRITFLIVSSYIVSLPLIVTISSFGVKKIIDRQVRDNYTNRINSIIDQLQATYEDLAKTGMQDLYKIQSQKEIVEKFTALYYSDKNAIIYPFILDYSGSILMHPDLTGDALKNEEFLKKSLSLKNGDMRYSFKSNKKWACFRDFKQWQWIVYYSIPEKVMYKDVGFFRFLITALTIIVAFLTIVVLHIFLSRLLSPLKHLTTTMNDINNGEGDLRKRINIVSNDEVGTLSGAFNSFIEKIQIIIKQVTVMTTEVTGASKSLSRTSAAFAQASQTAALQSTSMAEKAQQTSRKVNIISESTGTVSSMTSTVATAIEELNSSLSEVARNCQNELNIASNALNETQKTQEIMKKLGITAREIGKIVELINDIADQTNLLALNATIEAASAGDAGKGFAVVASEVKELAKQTASATEQISKQVEQMQMNTEQALNATLAVNGIIEDINVISQTIVSAVEEQSATVNEIARNISEASTVSQAMVKDVNESAGHVTDISSASTHLNESIENIAVGIKEIRGSAQSLESSSISLEKIVKQFKV